MNKPTIIFLFTLFVGAPALAAPAGHHAGCVLDAIKHKRGIYIENKDFSSAPLSADFVAAPLKYSVECVFQAVARRKNFALNKEIPLPEIFLESRTSLKEFQDAIEPQWGVRPEYFTNAYIERFNVIYLIDELAYYKRTARFVDDSLAHELTHYYQSKYKGWYLDGADDSIEMDAIEVQTWFRDEFMKTGKSPCP